MSDYFRLELARKIDRFLDLVAAGKFTPDPIELLQAAVILRDMGESARADRCVTVAARLMPNLQRGAGPS